MYQLPVLFDKKNFLLLSNIATRVIYIKKTTNTYMYIKVLLTGMLKSISTWYKAYKGNHIKLARITKKAVFVLCFCTSEKDFIC